MKTSNTSTESWILTEFTSFSHNDKRLDKRFNSIANDSMKNPAAPINQASEDWAATKGAYRYFNNPKVDRTEMFKAHQENTVKRIHGNEIIVIAHDTCILDYTNHTKLKGKGPIGTRAQDLSGYLMHSSLALTLSGTPLGLLTHDIWARDEIKENRNAQNKTLPVEEKESIKWINSIRETINLPNMPLGVEVIHVCDREADFFEFFDCLRDLKQKFVIRGRYDRAIEEDLNRVWDYTSKQPIALKETIKVSRNRVHKGGKNKKEFKASRLTEVEVKVAKVTFNPPCGTKNKKPIQVNIVYMKEINPPEGEEPVEWLLITNLPIDTCNEILKVINCYRLRWLIEEFHKILKTGCNVEKCFLENTEAMFRYITLFCIIAWRLFWIVRLQRINPEAFCTEALTESEWKALYCYLYKTNKTPDKIPTIREVIIWIARLGGFLARKNDGEPGIITIWRGWSRLSDIVEMYIVFSSGSRMSLDTDLTN